MALPLVLAGPLLRRVDTESVSVWMALSSAADVTVTVFQGSQTSTGAGTASGPVVATGTAHTRTFGSQLHVALVRAAATTALAPGSIYSYDVVVGGRGLKDLGLLRDATSDSSGQPNVDVHAPRHVALGYELDRLPSFAMAGAALADLKIVHTSCRKSNGEGPDALAWVDDEIKDHQLDPVQRPHQLFLTGDQIYANDVGACLLPLLSALGSELVGFTEHLPIAGQDVEASMANLPPLRRQRLVREIARFTSTDAANHLLTFSEWVGMYLLAFSPHAWRALATPANLFTAGPAQAAAWHLTDWETLYKNTDGWRTHKDPKTGKTTEEIITEETARVQQWRDATPKVARALANVPTYMICDDHEITDDWYLTKRWRSRVLTAPLGRQVVRNGLMAYTVFQGWGNDPAAFELKGQTLPPNLQVLQAVESFASDGMPTTQATRNTLDELLGLTQPVVDPKAVFSYQVPGPLHLVRVLDTRTRRRYDGEGDSPPKLLGDSLDSQLPAGPLTDGRTLLVVVSAAPVLFPRLFDVLVQPVAAVSFELTHHLFGEDDPKDPRAPGATITGAEQWDLEGWHAVEASHEAFLRRCGSYQRVVLLSGDVHFASSMVLDFWGKGRRRRGQPSRPVHCLCSPQPAGGADPGGAAWPAIRPGVPQRRAVREARLGRPSRDHGSTRRAPSPGPAGPAEPDPGCGQRRRLARPAPTVDPSKPPDYRWRLSTCATTGPTRRAPRTTSPRAASRRSAATPRRPTPMSSASTPARRAITRTRCGSWCSVTTSASSRSARTAATRSSSSTRSSPPSASAPPTEIGIPSTR